MLALNSLFYAAATFLLAEIAQAGMTPLLIFDPDHWTALYDWTGLLVYAGPAFFVLVAVVAVGRAGDERERRRREGAS